MHKVMLGCEVHCKIGSNVSYEHYKTFSHPCFESVCGQNEDILNVRRFNGENRVK